MANTRMLVNRRKAVRNIKKITRTMELIATARFKKALDRATEAEAYTRKITEMAADLSASATDVKHPLLQKREEVRNTLLLVIGSTAVSAAATTPPSSAKPITGFHRSAAKTSICTWNYPANDPLRSSAIRASNPNAPTHNSRTSRASRKSRRSPTATSRASSAARTIASRLPT